METAEIQDPQNTLKINDNLMILTVIYFCENIENKTIMFYLNPHKVSHLPVLPQKCI